MLFVGFRYYQNSLIRDGWTKEEDEEEETSIQQAQAHNKGPVKRPRRRPITLESTKQKKAF